MSVTSSANIFYHPVSCLFILFIVSFAVQKVLNLIKFHLFIFINFYWSMVALQCCISTVQQSKSGKCLHISPIFWICLLLGHHGALNRAPVLCSGFSLVTCFIHSINRVYMSIPICYFIPFNYPLGEGNGNPLQYSCLENPMD